MGAASNERVQLVDADGTTIGPTGILGEYQITDKDDDTATKYYGFTKSDGSYYIMRETTSSGDQLYRYTAGSSAYTTAWTNRATESYDYFYNTF